MQDLLTTSHSGSKESLKALKKNTAVLNPEADQSIVDRSFETALRASPSVGCKSYLKHLSPDKTKYDYQSFASFDDYASFDDISDLTDSYTEVKSSENGWNWQQELLNQETDKLPSESSEAQSDLLPDDRKVQDLNSSDDVSNYDLQPVGTELTERVWSNRKCPLDILPNEKDSLTQKNQHMIESYRELIQLEGQAKNTKFV